MTVTALPWDGVSPTKHVADPLGWTPHPTEAPIRLYEGEMGSMAGKRIFGRAVSDQVCGYFDDGSCEVMAPLFPMPMVN